ncbi:MAG TPA: hypothetical protein VJ724_13240 [Tahibacter sp.]|nr:hypothetical protein [Tahibacter sp.]
MSGLRRAVLVLLVVVSAVVAADERPAAAARKLNEEQVAQAVGRYLEKQGTRTAGFRILPPRFIADRGLWVVSFRSGAKELGSGNHFDVFVSDADIDDIRYEPGR